MEISSEIQIFVHKVKRARAPAREIVEAAYSISPKMAPGYNMELSALVPQQAAGQVNLQISNSEALI